MSALSPYAVEFVQGEAYAGKLNEPSKKVLDKLTDSMSQVKIGTAKQSRPKCGQAYDVSLESMLIETALSRLPHNTVAGKPEKARPEREPRKKKIIRPSDANRKLSKLKKSVVTFREEQAREAAAAVEESAPELSGSEVKTNEISETKSDGRLEKAESDESLEAALSGNTSTSSDEKLASQEDQSSSNEASVSEKIERASHESTSPLINSAANPRKQPLKRTPTMDRLKANLQGEALKEVEQLATELIIALKRFQDRLYNKDEIKARMRQRMYYGLKESLKFMQVQKVKMIIMARDLEAGPGGLDELIENLLSKAKIHRVPVVVALSRNKLKRLSQKPSKVACIAITDPSGRDEQFHKILEIVKPLGLMEGLNEASRKAAEAEEQQRKAQQDLESWTSTTRRGRFEFAVDKLFTAKPAEI